MAARPANFKQVDVRRAVKAARAAGVDVGRIELDPSTGKIVLVAKGDPSVQSNSLDRWLADHADKT